MQWFSQSRLPSVVGAGIVATALVGCGTEPPGCADGQTLSLVKEVFWSTVGKLAVNPSDKTLLAQVRPKFDVSLQSPRVTEKQVDVAKVLCAGTLKVSLADDASRSVDKLFKRGVELEVEYSSQFTADGKQHVVELDGHGPGVEYVWGLAQMGAFGPSQGAAGASPAASGATASAQEGALAAAGTASREPPAQTAPEAHQPAGSASATGG